MAAEAATAAGAPAAFGAALRRHRLAAGLSQDALAERAGLSARAISDLERGVSRAPRPATLRLLADALGLAPAARAALAGAAPPAGPGGPVGETARGASPRPPHTAPPLPARRTSFVGREGEAAALRARLGQPGGPRLVTLTGPGGVGKTRLALEAAAALLAAPGGPDGQSDGGSGTALYPDGVWWVDLAPLADGALVPRAALAAVGGREGPGRSPLAALVEHLRPRAALLVLDNCEHLVEACATLADALLEGCPGVRLLATSREPLGVAGEALFGVPSLSLPDPRDPPPAEALPHYEAVRLFIERAAAVRPAFAVTPRNAAAVAGICARLDGLPLALELAAARVRILPVGQLLARLEDRFRLLTGGPRTALERHRSLRAAVDWSYGLLSAPERRLFARLAVFAGGWTLEAAEAVGAGAGVAAADVLDLLARLAAQSLVVADEAGDGAARFGLLETLREYALERLEESGEAGAVRERHAAYYLALAEASRPTLEEHQTTAWLARLGREYGNARAALRWLSEQGTAAAAEQGLRLAAALVPYWDANGQPREGREWFDVFLELTSPAGQPAHLLAARAGAAHGAGTLAFRQGDHAAARRLLEESLALSEALGDRRGAATALGSLGQVATFQGDYQAAQRHLQDSLATFQAVGDRPGAASAASLLGRVATHRAEYGAASALLDQSAALFRELGDRRGAAAALNLLARVADRQARYAAARRLLEESLALSEALGDRRGAATALTGLGRVAAHAGDHTQAQAVLERSSVLWQELGDTWGVAATLSGLGSAAAVRGERGAAVALFERSLPLFSELGDRWAVASTLNQLGRLSCRGGDHAAARRLLNEGLSLWRELGDPEGAAWCVEGLAAVSRGHGQLRRAARLWGAADAVREAIGAPLPTSERPWYEYEVAEARTRLGEPVFAAAWTQGRAMPLAQAIACAQAEAAARET